MNSKETTTATKIARAWVKLRPLAETLRELGPARIALREVPPNVQTVRISQWSARLGAARTRPADPLPSPAAEAAAPGQPPASYPVVRFRKAETQKINPLNSEHLPPQ